MPLSSMRNNETKITPWRMFFRLGAGGMTLLEVMIVMAIIAGLAGFLLPNLNFTAGSQISIALRDLTATIRGSYDSAILSGRLHRLVVKPKTGEYWVEEAPLDFKGRPTDAFANEDTNQNEAEERQKLLEELNKAAEDPRKSEKGDYEYSQRSIMVVQRGIFKPIKWNVVEDALVGKHAVPIPIVFFKIDTANMEEPIEFQSAGDKTLAYIYFFPWGEVTQTQFLIGMVDGAKNLRDDGSKYTVKVDPLTGLSELKDGFPESDVFKDEKKKK